MAAKSNPGSPFQDIGIHPLSGGLDVRSRPAEIAPGSFRWKLNASITSDGKLGRRAQFCRAFADMLYDDEGKLLSDPTAGAGVHYHNHDLHHQDQSPRTMLDFLYENTDQDGARTLWAGNQSSVFLLDEATGSWTAVLSGLGAYSYRWRAAASQNQLFFANGIDPVQVYDMDAGTSAPLYTILEGTELPGVERGIYTAFIVKEYNGFILLMNLTGQDDAKYPTRVAWSNLNDPLVWGTKDAADQDSVAGYQDLPYGDAILGAVECLGSLYIFTRRSIWRCYISNGALAFERKYTEPENQTACLVYPWTLVSTGLDMFYMSRDGIYRFNPTMVVPVRDDWLYKASGAIYTKEDTRMGGQLCHLPVAGWRPETREVWFSWPSGSLSSNNWSMVAQLDQSTADIVDHGFTAFCNYRRTPQLSLCNEAQSFLGISGTDWAIKSIGTVFYRDICVIGADPTVDPVENDATYATYGYNTQLRGTIPLGYADRDKLINFASLEDDTTAEANPLDVWFRIGQSHSLVDSNATDAISAPKWQTTKILKLAPDETLTLAQMAAQNIKPSKGKNFPCHAKDRYLYFEMNIGVYGASREAIGGDSCFESIGFSVRGLPKPAIP